MGGESLPALTPYMSLSQVLDRLTDIRIWAMLGPLYLGLGLLLAIDDYKLSGKQDDDENDGWRKEQACNA